MKPKILFLFAFLIVAGLSSCLKTYTCECETTYYTTFRVDSTSKKTASFNGSRKSPVVQDCARLQDSVKNAEGTGWVTKCDIKD